jgi:hypothetical protein
VDETGADSGRLAGKEIPSPMTSLRRVLVFISLLAVFAPVRAAQAPDPVLVDALKASLSNGVEAALRALYQDRPYLAVELRDKLVPLTKDFGVVIDTEIVAVQAVSKRVTRFYIAIYFEHRPLWLRVERYVSDQKTFYLPLRYSLQADEILPGYVTEFNSQP